MASADPTVLGVMSDLQQDIERLAIWWIPALLITIALGSYSEYHLNQSFQGNDYSPAELISQLGFANLFLDRLLSNLDHLVIAIWLIHTTKLRLIGTPWIWGTLGIVAGLFAAILYVGLRIYAKYESSIDA